MRGRAKGDTRGGGPVGNSAFLCQEAPILMQKHFLRSVVVFDSQKRGKTHAHHSGAVSGFQIGGQDF